MRAEARPALRGTRRALLAATLGAVALPALAQIAPPLYLQATGVPTSSLSTSAPTAATLPNYDPGRDSAAGLILEKDGTGAGESDPEKYQRWLGPVGATNLSGTARLVLWSAIKDFRTDKRGVVSAYLRDCDSAGNGCNTIASSTLDLDPWSGTSGWIERTFDFGQVDYTVAGNRRIELKVIVPKPAEDKMWFAYGTTGYPSRLEYASPGGALPGSFNAFETSTAGGATSGVIKTKVAGTPFTLAVVALNATRSGLATKFAGTVSVELLDARDNTGALDPATGCRSTWSNIATVSPNPAFAAADNGRIDVSFNAQNAWREVRVRVTEARAGTTVVGCSSDAFAIRPAAFANLQATDDTDATSGVTRVLNNSSATSGVVHRAGRAFTVLAAAVSSTGATTSGYDGAPVLAIASCAQPAGCTAGSFASSLSAAAGAISGTASYSEAGVFTATLADTTFAAVDAADSTAAERTIGSSAVTIGRFVPDAYRLSTVTAPAFAAPLCGAGPASQSFVYVGQPFDLGTLPAVLATPINASGQVLANARPRFGTSAVTTAVAAAGAPVALSGSIDAGAVAGAATATITFTATSFSFTRGTTPVASFSPAIAMTVDVSDTTETATAGNTAIADEATLTISPIAFSGGAGTFHYGRVQMYATFGDYRRDLVVPLEVQAWNGLGWIPFGSAAACFSAGATAFAYSQPTGGLAGGGGAFNCATRVAATVTTGNGRAAITLAKPANTGTTQPSAMTMTLNLLATAAGQSCSALNTSTAATTVAMPWLASPAGANASARVTWGRVRGDVVDMRERFD